MSPATANAIAACYLPGGIIRSDPPGRGSLAFAAWEGLTARDQWARTLGFLFLLGMTAEQRTVFVEAYRWAEGRDTRFAPEGFETW